MSRRFVDGSVTLSLYADPSAAVAYTAVVTSILDTLSVLPVWAQVVVLLVTALVAAKAFDLVVIRLFREAAGRTATTYDNILVEELHLPVTLTIVVAGALVATATLPETITTAEWFQYADRALLSGLVLLWVRTGNRIGNRLLAQVATGDYEYASFAPVFSNLMTFALVVGGLFAALKIWNVDVTPLLASAGIVGIAVGFAAKDTVANFFGGLALYFDRTYELGDYVVLDSGEAGTVVKVGIRSTTIRTRDDVLVTVPNAVLNSATIRNESAPQRKKRIRVSVGVAYGSDIDAVETILTDVADQEDLVLDSPRPRVRFLRFGDSALEYQIRCWVPSPTRETKARHRLNRAIYRRFDEAGIAIPFPQRDVNLRSMDGSSSEEAGRRVIESAEDADD
jgi:small-conductance mechanosensitive channel